VRLGKRIVLATGSLVVMIGFVTMGMMQAIVTQALGQELDQKGLTAARVLANDLANPLLDGEDLVVQRNLNRFSQEGPSVIYAYVIGPDRQRLVHTFADGVPSTLYAETALQQKSAAPQVRLLLTEQGRIRDYGVRVLDGLDAELHIGLAEQGILATNRRVMSLIFGMTAAGVSMAVLLAWVLGRYVARPLEYLTATAEEIGEGRLEKEIPIESTDEVGDLADSFNRMLARLREAMGREQKRNRELTALNAVSKVVSLGDDLPQVLTQSLQEVVEALGLRGGWIMLLNEGQSQAGEVAAAVGLDPSEITGCLRAEGPCSCWSAIQSGDVQARTGPLTDCPMAPHDGERMRIVGPIPLVAGGKMLGFLNVILAPDHPLDDQAYEMLRGIGRQLGVALEQALLWLKLREREQRVSQLLQKVIDAQEEERKRIARELHDETSQSMATLAVGLKAAASLVHRDPNRAESMLESLKETTTHTLHEIHNIVYDLRPTLLDDRGLVPALHWCATQRLGPQGVAIDVGQGGIRQRLPPEVETTLFRIAQEAINNVAKHADAQTIRIHVQTEERSVRLSVADDGRGIPLAAENGEQSDKRPLGLVGMAERAKLLGGQCRVNSVPGEGTRIDVTIPLEGGRAHDPHLAG